MEAELHNALRMVTSGRAWTDRKLRWSFFVLPWYPLKTRHGVLLTGLHIYGVAHTGFFLSMGIWSHNCKLLKVLVQNQQLQLDSRLFLSYVTKWNDYFIYIPVHCLTWWVILATCISRVKPFHRRDRYLSLHLPPSLGWSCFAASKWFLLCMILVLLLQLHTWSRTQHSLESIVKLVKHTLQRF